jgi:predicted regulator of Ras-like GTPase activity (Roadblock/LC7/MglB family)
MLEPILQGLREVDGVQGAMLVDAGAAVVAHRAHTIYDLTVLQQVARAVVSTIDSVQLIQDDWDVLTANFGDGKLLLRSLRTAGTRPRRYVLAVIADATLNAAFLGVALRVAAGKLLAELEAGPPAANSTVSAASLLQPSGSSAVRAAGPSGASGLTWSGTTAGSGVGSGVGGSDVIVIDPASSAFLSACTKALAASIGPMARVFVKEAVRKVCGERPFSRADGPALLAHLAAGIADNEDRASFQRATRTL